MAVELRCPDCRAKLRLKAAPEAGTEVECPKCGTVFPAPEPEPEDDADAPLKTAKSDDEKPKKSSETRDKKADAKKGPGGEAKAPRKRKAKKRETSKTALIAVICAGTILIACMSGVLVWYFTRTSKAVEMFYYVPEDAQAAWGINLGHVQKYPVFYKAINALITGAPFKPAADAVAKAAGTDMDGLVDYVAVAESLNGGVVQSATIVFRTKTEFDAADLSKIPGAEKKTLDGKTYYLVPSLLQGNASARVFAPTNRLVVVCPDTINEPVFKKMINGHPDSRDKTLGVRMGALGKRVTRGTFWQLMMFDNAATVEDALPPVNAAAAGGKSSADDPKAKKRAEYSDGMKGSFGIGVKASLGSRELRLEMIVSEKDGGRASEYAKKMKESEIGKGDEGTPPPWFKDETSSLGDKKIGAQVISNLGFGASGELFFVKTAVDTTDVQQSATKILGMVLGKTAQSAGGSPGIGPGGPGVGPGGGGGPVRPGGPPGAPGPPGRPNGPPGGKPRRRYNRARC